MALASKFRDMTNRFRAKSTEDLETVRTRLARAEAATPSLQKQLDEAALAAALSEDYTAAEVARAALDAQRNKVQLLRTALVAAEEAERVRLDGAHIREQQGRLRAFRAHAGNIVKGAGEYEQAVAAANRAWKRMRDAADAAISTLPSAEVFHRYAELCEAQVRRACELELYRIGYVNAHLGPMPDLPGASAGKAFALGERPDRLPPLSERLRNIVEQYGKQFAQSLKLEPAPAVPALAPDAPVYRPTPGTEDWYQQQKVASTGREPVGDNPHPVGTPEHDGYRADLALIQPRRNPAFAGPRNC